MSVVVDLIGFAIYVGSGVRDVGVCLCGGAVVRWLTVNENGGERITGCGAGRGEREGEREREKDMTGKTKGRKEG